jgi:hypothetical protein
MLTSEIIKIRNLVTSISHTNLNDGKARPIGYHIMLDNEHGINTTVCPTFWDDTNEMLYSFGINSFDFQNSINYGNGKIHNPGMVTIVDYSEIQQVKVILSEIDFDAFCDKVGSSIISAEQRENVRKKLFIATDPEYNIKLRAQTHY